MHASLHTSFIGMHALKGQKLLAQGIARGIMTISNAPCKGKSFVIIWFFEAFALTGRVFKIRIKIWYKKWCYIGVFKLLIFNTLIYKTVL